MAKDPKPMEVLNAQAKQAVNETKQAPDRMKQAVEETKGQALGAADTLFRFSQQDDFVVSFAVLIQKNAFQI